MNIKIKREVLIVEISDSPKIESLILWLNYGRPQFYLNSEEYPLVFAHAAHYLQKETGSLIIPLDYVEKRFSDFTIDEDKHCSYADVGEIMDEIQIMINPYDANINVYICIKQNLEN